jgi:hypothetical protein
MRRIAPQQYRIAVQQNQANRRHGSHALRAADSPEIHIIQCIPTPSERLNASKASLGVKADGRELRFATRNFGVWARASSRRRKKEAARRRPESREETPKEGMYGKHRTSNILAPNPTNARSQCRF